MTKFALPESAGEWSGWGVNTGTLSVEPDGGLSVLHHKALGEGLTSYVLVPSETVAMVPSSKELSFDVRAKSSGYYDAGYGYCGDVVVHGAGGVAAAHLPNPIGGDWRSVRLSLTDAGSWAVHGATLSEVMAHATSIQLRAEFGTGADDVGFAHYNLK